MSIRFLKLDDKQLKGYIYLNEKYSDKQRQNGAIVDNGIIYKFHNLNGYKSLCIKMLVKDEVKEEIKQNTYKKRNSVIENSKIEESISSGYEYNFKDVFCYPNIYNGFISNDIYVSSIVKDKKSDFNISIENHINNVKLPKNEYINYINVRDLPIDFEGTFGTCKFNGMVSYSYKTDEFGETTQEIESIKYEILSSKQGFFNVTISGDEVVKIDLGKEIELENLYVENFAIARTNTFGYRALATNIIEKRVSNSDLQQKNSNK